MWDYISNSITEETGRPFIIKKKTRVMGGDINQAWKISSKTNSYFVKINTLAMHTMFKEESKGLQALNVVNGTRIPKVIFIGTFAHQSFLILEYIDMSDSGGSFETLAAQLSSIHKKTNNAFGFTTDNFIGSTPQSNTLANNWSYFYGNNRLLPQLNLAKENGYTDFLEIGYQLIDTLDTYFSSYQPQASLLHGDLWGGNIAFDENQQPVIYDPACYYGDREADIAMTELFGRLPDAFYQAYNNAWQLDEGYRVRKHLYNLYHILNHCNLFGGGYQTQAYIVIKKLLCEIY